MPPGLRNLWIRLLHFIVTAFLAVAKRKFVILRHFLKKILAGRRKRPKIFQTNCQKPRKTGRSSRPTVDSHKRKPAARPLQQPTRMSPRHTPKHKISQNQNNPTTKTRSAKTVSLGRSGRKKPYRQPRAQPSPRAMRKWRASSAGGVIGRPGATSCRYPGVARKPTQKYCRPQPPDLRPGRGF